MLVINLQLSINIYNSIGPALPNDPHSVRIAAMQSDTILVTWNSSVVVYGPESYVVRYGTSMADLNLSSDTLMVTHVLLTGLLENTEYFFRVEATNSIGTAASTISTFTTPQG